MLLLLQRLRMMERQRERERRPTERMLRSLTVGFNSWFSRCAHRGHMSAPPRGMCALLPSHDPRASPSSSRSTKAQRDRGIIEMFVMSGAVTQSGTRPPPAVWLGTRSTAGTAQRKPRKRAAKCKQAGRQAACLSPDSQRRSSAAAWRTRRGLPQQHVLFQLSPEDSGSEELASASWGRHHRPVGEGPEDRCFYPTRGDLQPPIRTSTCASHDALTHNTFFIHTAGYAPFFLPVYLFSHWMGGNQSFQWEPAGAKLGRLVGETCHIHPDVHCHPSWS